MRSLVSPLVLVLLAGCGPLKGCGRSTPVATAPAPAAPPPPAPAAPKPPEPPEARFAGQYLVIVHSSPTPGEGEALVEKLRAAGLGEPVRLATTPFASLRSCLEVVVAGAFADKPAALELSRRLDAAGVGNYLKNAGALADDVKGREDSCREQAAARARAAARALAPEGPFFVETRGARTFLLLVSGEPLDGPGPELRQVGQDRGFWMASLKEDPTGVLKKGARFDIYDGAHGQVKAGCRVKGFALLHRGTPHFSYFQQEEAPEEPGCGAHWPVAELDCSLVGTRAMESEAILFALATGRPEPRYLSRTDALPEHVKHAQEKLLRALPEFEQTREGGLAHAQEQGEPLQESLEVYAYPLEGRSVVVGLARFQTGEGHTFCGGADFRATVSRVVSVSADEQEEPVGNGLSAESIVSVLDLEGDGRVELFTRSLTDASQVALVGEDGEERLSRFVPNCDCGC